ncbi:MAG: hypothetical protein ACD_23C00235G0001, partial [uncultured bacterium]
FFRRKAFAVWNAILGANHCDGFQNIFAAISSRMLMVEVWLLLLANDTTTLVFCVIKGSGS